MDGLNHQSARAPVRPGVEHVFATLYPGVEHVVALWRFRNCGLHLKAYFHARSGETGDRFEKKQLTVTDVLIDVTPE